MSYRDNTTEMSALYFFVIFITIFILIKILWQTSRVSLAQGCNEEKKEMIGSRQQGKGTAKMKKERQNGHIS
jgi:hypothetical protein